jgi:phospholipid transport system substrate-binding protein
MRNVLKRVMVVSVAFVLFAYSVFAFAEQSPVDLLKSLADQMIHALKENKASLKSNPSLVYSFANRIVVPHADLEEMSKRVLPPNTWRQATPDQQRRFKKEFTSLLVRTYASALSDYTNEIVEFYPVRGGYEGKSNVQVNSKIIRSDGPSVPVSYRLVRKGSSWMLFDMSVEGISLLESFRSQFADKLSQGNMEGLIQQLAAHNGRGG